MTFRPAEDDNPFAPPRSSIGTRAPENDQEVDSDAVRVRLEHLSHESSIKSVGLMAYLLGCFGAFFAVAGVLAGSGVMRGNAIPPGSDPAMVRLTMWLGAAVWAFAGLIGVGLGFGFRRLQVWARWTGIVLLVLSILYTLMVGLFLSLFFGNVNIVPVFAVLLILILIQGYIFFLLVIPKSGMVFSSEYHLIIRKTPAIACGSSLIVKLAFGIVVTLIGLFLAAMIASAFQ
jgi:hypothetical protein